MRILLTFVFVSLMLPAPAAAAITPDAAVGLLNAHQDKRPQQVTEWYPDEATGTVVVSVHGGGQATLTAAASWAKAAGVAAVDVREVPSAPRPLWYVIGGELLRTPSGYRCSLGFNARRSDGTNYVLTAGHCVMETGTYYGVGGPIGDVVGWQFPGRDSGLIRITATAPQPTPWVTMRPQQGRVTIGGSVAASVGTSVCAAGIGVGWRCGTILARNGTVCYPQGCINGMIRVNVCGGPGDSGGPLVTAGGPGTRVQAQGVLSGASGTCSTGGVSYFQPILPMLSQWGLTLHTG